MDILEWKEQMKPVKDLEDDLSEVKEKRDVEQGDSEKV